MTNTQFQSSSYIYAITYILSGRIFSDPLPFITYGLGLVPLAFSILFWLVPCFRYFLEKRENEGIRLENLRKIGFTRIWSGPGGVKSGDIDSPAAECRPKNMAAARDRIIKDMGAYSLPEVELNEQGETVYVFKGLQRERETLEKCRSAVDPSVSALGKTVFDSEGPPGPPEA
jgi:hypothetical protein